jgi:TorA maturation chaperone TorD
MRSQLYMFASGLFNQPTLARLHMLRELLAQLTQAMPQKTPWGDTLVALEAKLDYDEDMEVEYSRLFILAFPSRPVQPFGSYWLETDQHLFGESTLEIKKMMAEHGIEVTDNTGLLPDHIVSELEFMAYLAGLDDTTTHQTQQELLEQHLALWTPQFTEALRAANPACHYRLAADFLDQLIAWDMQNFMPDSIT